MHDSILQWVHLSITHLCFRQHSFWYSGPATLPSVFWRCWLGSRKGIRPVKTEWWDVGVVIWDEVQTCIWPSRCHCHSLSLAPVNPDWFYLPGFYLSGTCSPGWSWTNSRRAVKRLCVCVTLAQPPGTVFHLLCTTSLTLILLKHGSCLIVHIGDHCVALLNVE